MQSVFAPLLQLPRLMCLHACVFMRRIRRASIVVAPLLLLLALRGEAYRPSRKRFVLREKKSRGVLIMSVESKQHTKIAVRLTVLLVRPPCK